MKNWFVSVEQKKRSGEVSERTKKRNKAKDLEPEKANRNTLENSVKYLLNDKHNNHKLTEITDLGNARLSRDHMFDAYNDMVERHGKGTSNIASSFVLSMPSDLYHPTTDEWRDIADLTIENFVDEVNRGLEKREEKHNKITPKQIAKMSERKLKEHHLNTDRFAQRLDLDEVKKLSTAVIHDDRNKPLIVGATAGSHLNIVMSNIFNGDVMKYISQNGGSFSMKTAYSNAVKEKLGLDCDLYLPYSSRPEDEKLKNFYTGNTDHLDIVEVNENTPHKDKIIKIIDPTQTTLDQNKPLWFKKQEKSIILQAEKDKIEENLKKLNSSKSKNIKIVKIGRKEKKALKIERETLIKAEKNINAKSKKVDKKSNELTNYFNNILESDLIKSFVDKIIARGKAKHIGPMELADTETKLIKEFNEELIESYRELNPQELEKHVEREKIKADEFAVRVKNRHDTNEFKTQQELDIEKSKSILNTPKKKTIKEKLVKLGTRLGMLN